MKRIVTIQDISCVGKCSLTVALPIISAMGVEAAIMPTAVLSNHTAFSAFTFHDLTAELDPIAEQWKKEKIDFDAIYTGYLGSFEQIDIVSKFFDDFRTEGNIIIADPAMGDDGKLYTGFTPEFALHMGKMCGKADVMVPNLTEAAFMLNEPYVAEGYDEEYIKGVLRRLCALGAKKSVLTGVSFEPDKLGVMSYDSEKDAFFTYFNEKLDVHYHGTGDVFASTLTGAMMNDLTLEQALEVAVDYTVECIRETLKDKNGNWYGVNFEAAVPFLVRRLGK